MSRAVQKKVEKNAEELHDILAHSLNCLQRIRHRVVHVRDLVQHKKRLQMVAKSVRCQLFRSASAICSHFFHS